MNLNNSETTVRKTAIASVQNVNPMNISSRVMTEVDRNVFQYQYSYSILLTKAAICPGSHDFLQASASGKSIERRSTDLFWLRHTSHMFYENIKEKY